MAGLVLKLAPNERILINGAVIENGDRRTRISIKTPRANVLRLADAIPPDEANTPVSRACYLCQLVLSGDLAEPEGRHRLVRSIEQLSQVFTDADSRKLLAQASEAAIGDNAYQALKALRLLLPREARVFAAMQ